MSSALRANRGPLVRVVTFMVLVAVVTATVWNLLSGPGFSDTVTFRADFTDVSGLATGDEVRVAGVGVGTVTGVDLRPGNRARVTFTAQRAVRLTGATTATVKYRNLTGNRYLALAPGSSGDAAPLRAGALIPVARTAPALDLDALFGGFQPLLDALNPQQVNQLSDQLIEVLQGEGGNVLQLIQNVAELTNRLADRDAVIGQVVTNLNTVLGAADRHSEAVSKGLDQMQKLATGLAEQRRTFVPGLVATSRLAGQTSGLLADLRPQLTNASDQVGQLSALLTNGRNAPTLDRTLKQLPDAYLRISGVGSYGTFYNFYICGLGLTFTSASGQPASVPFQNFGDARCRR